MTPPHDARSSGSAATCGWATTRRCATAIARAARDGGDLLPVFVWEPRERRPLGAGRGRRAGGCGARWSRSTASCAGGLAAGARAGRPRGHPARAGPRGARAARSCGPPAWSPTSGPTTTPSRRRSPRGGVEAVVVPSANLLFDPAAIRTREGRPYTVFTPYWRACLSEPAPAAAAGRASGAARRRRRRRPASRSTQLEAEARQGLGSRVRRRLAAGRGRRPPRASRGCCRGPLAAYADERDRPDLAEHLAPLAAPSLGRAERAPGVAGGRRRAGRGRPRPRGRHRPAGAGRRAGAGPAAVRRRLPPPARLARVRSPPAAALPADARAAAPRALRRLPVARRPGRARGLAARPDRLPFRGRGDARALGHRLDAQPRAARRGVLPGQASPAAVAARRGVVLGHPRRRRPRRTTPWAGSGWPGAAPTRRPTSASSTR